MSCNIFEAARKGSLTEHQIRNYKRSNGNLDARDNNGLTLLCAAAMGGHLSAVRRLLRNGAAVNEPSIHNCSALWFATRLLDKGKTVAICKQLLEAGAKVNIISDPAMLATTPLMNLLRAGQGLSVLSLLLVRGASVSFPGGTASAERDVRFIGNRQHIEALKCSQPAQQKSYFASAKDYLLEVWTAVLGKFVTKPITSSREEVKSGVGENPNSNTEEPRNFDHAKFKNNLTRSINKARLTHFFPDNSPFLDTVMAKAAELAESSDSALASPEYLPELAQLSLYQPILFCDNSGSMNKKDRIDCIIDVAGKVTEICALLLPDTEGVQIRFLNSGSQEEALYKQYHTVRTSKDAANMVAEARFSGPTLLGTTLKRVVLQPFLYDVLNNGPGQLKRPLLIFIITDGCPYGEDYNQLSRVIAECKITLRDRGIDIEAVKFQISQIGDDSSAQNFLRDLSTDPDIQGNIYITSGKVDEEFKNREENDEQLDAWVITLVEDSVL